ncbi:MAG: DUF2283 domain-containing protein [Actinomycetota bacterium]
MSQVKAFYTYDAEADVLYALLVPEDEARISKTVELSPTLHVDLDGGGGVVGVEILYPASRQIDLVPLKDQFGVELRLPFSFAA